LNIEISPDSGIEYASIDSTKKLYSRATAFIAKIRLVVDRGPVNITVVSIPNEARIELSTQRGDTTAKTTISEFPNLYRGLYNYKVTREGYKTIVGDLNLVDEDGTLLECKLYEVGEKEDPNPCTLKKVP